MAAADYRLCDCCDGKVFYDSNLNYEYDEVLPSGHMALDYLGDWAVICSDCAKTHKTVVLTNEQAVQLAAAPAIAAPTEVERDAVQMPRPCSHCTGGKVKSGLTMMEQPCHICAGTGLIWPNRGVIAAIATGEKP